MKKLLFLFGLFASVLLSCSGEENTKTSPVIKVPIKYLALGDSYTIGESVCESCRFPAQLKTKIEPIANADVKLDIIAQTGWTTSNLTTAIQQQAPASDYDLVTLLIGVNNQYQHKPFSLYETEFPELLNTAITLAKGNKDNVIVVSIPDYAFTPFGNGNPTISQEIDSYNTFAKDHSAKMGVSFINITDITRMGLENPDLVASDGLHPSQLAYEKFVELLLPVSVSKLSE